MAHPLGFSGGFFCLPGAVPLTIFYIYYGGPGLDFQYRATIMDTDQIRRAIKRIAHEIVERNTGVKNIVAVGIRRRGVYLAERIATYLETIEGEEVPTGILDITLYRDDFQTMTSKPVIGKTEIKVDITNKVIVLVDDVLYTGRTVRAALDELIDFGRPRQIQLAVLVDRGHREFPIKADYVGKNIPTSEREQVEVHLREFDGEDEVILGELVPS
ncbi:MAG: bifunctional pyr operon transcriptional regulator/uracil phosphoribosyltransferase PyrR [Candidatus Latescibacteria bacterium]|nr:bifunctional pyr operon transcriptional regulator/uracil phosphoribosyltransferase PyrR [Candidatus Latescibacterota bacterium]NIM22305.1 bifunctional pyr operon transcriptional regulator/uracil phosphoribosyltransferase PyrR [Candidatus Latescibacterota bacterium]NIM66134.1 bifunctional pyr operon transcriptional regulator/uracil phosphoribosyltransferase PyrR [Candidatus Latescibacterota bacterium]NIO02542.1 bifunctional pyr operon transcriptional regulator/uracil phosphoribosyltransferase 